MGLLSAPSRSSLIRFSISFGERWSPSCERLQKASPGEQQDELCLTVDESLHSDAFKSLQLCDPASLGIPGGEGKELPTLTGISPLSISDKQAPARTFLLTSCRYGFIPVGIAPLGIDEVIPRSGSILSLSQPALLLSHSVNQPRWKSGSLEKEAFRYTTQCGLDGCGSQSERTFLLRNEWETWLYTSIPFRT
ncbi:hypothetical protein RIF29_46985 [Crotalaria pallida]|uniref:Uncharacterized protein n=1 Tax=Crotalaria pallida TaxID=3830 RepID=A0AAN9HNC1_CROPI